MECSACQAQEAVGACRECRTALCDGCGLTCQRCKELVCSKHSGTTSHGRLLCDSCMADRNTALQKRRRAAAKAKQKETIEAAQAAAAAKPKKVEEDLSFAALAGDEPLPVAKGKASAEPEPPEEDGLDVEEDKETAEAKRDPFDVSGKLDLGYVDEKRPLLTANAYKPASKWRYLPMMIVLFLVLWYVYTSVPALRAVVVVGSLIGALIFGIWWYRNAKAKSEVHRPEKR